MTLDTKVQAVRQLVAACDLARPIEHNQSDLSIRQQLLDLGEGHRAVRPTIIAPRLKHDDLGLLGQNLWEPDLRP